MSDSDEQTAMSQDASDPTSGSNPSPTSPNQPGGPASPRIAASPSSSLTSNGQPEYHGSDDDPDEPEYARLVQLLIPGTSEYEAAFANPSMRNSPGPPSTDDQAAAMTNGEVVRYIRNPPSDSSPRPVREVYKVVLRHYHQRMLALTEARERGCLDHGDPTQLPTTEHVQHIDALLLAELAAPHFFRIDRSGEVKYSIQRMYATEVARRAEVAARSEESRQRIAALPASATSAMARAMTHPEQLSQSSSEASSSGAPAAKRPTIRASTPESQPAPPAPEVPIPEPTTEMNPGDQPPTSSRGKPPSKSSARGRSRRPSKQSSTQSFGSVSDAGSGELIDFPADQLSLLRQLNPGLAAQLDAQKQVLRALMETTRQAYNLVAGPDSQLNSSNGTQHTSSSSSQPSTATPKARSGRSLRRDALLTRQLADAAQFAADALPDDPDIDPALIPKMDNSIIRIVGGHPVVFEAPAANVAPTPITPHALASHPASTPDGAGGHQAQPILATDPHPSALPSRSVHPHTADTIVYSRMMPPPQTRSSATTPAVQPTTAPPSLPLASASEAELSSGTDDERGQSARTRDYGPPGLTNNLTDGHVCLQITGSSYTLAFFHRASLFCRCNFREGSRIQLRADITAYFAHDAEWRLVPEFEAHRPTKFGVLVRRIPYSTAMASAYPAKVCDPLFPDDLIRQGFRCRCGLRPHAVVPRTPSVEEYFHRDPIWVLPIDRNPNSDRMYGALQERHPRHDGSQPWYPSGIEPATGPILGMAAATSTANSSSALAAEVRAMADHLAGQPMSASSLPPPPIGRHYLTLRSEERQPLQLFARRLDLLQRGFRVQLPRHAINEALHSLFLPLFSVDRNSAAWHEFTEHLADEIANEFDGPLLQPTIHLHPDLVARALTTIFGPTGPFPDPSGSPDALQRWIGRVYSVLGDSQTSVTTRHLHAKLRLPIDPIGPPFLPSFSVSADPQVNHVPTPSTVINTDQPVRGPSPSTSFSDTADPSGRLAEELISRALLISSSSEITLDAEAWLMLIRDRCSALQRSSSTAVVNAVAHFEIQVAHELAVSGLTRPYTFPVTSGMMARAFEALFAPGTGHLNHLLTDEDFIEVTTSLDTLNVPEDNTKLELTCRRCPQHCLSLAFATHESTQHPLCCECTDFTLACPPYFCANCQPDAFYQSHRPRLADWESRLHRDGRWHILRPKHPLYPISADLETLLISNLDLLFSEAKSDQQDVKRLRFFLSDIIRAIASDSRRLIPAPSSGNPDRARVSSELVIEISHAHQSALQPRGQGGSQGP